MDRDDEQDNKQDINQKIVKPEQEAPSAPEPSADQPAPVDRLETPVSQNTVELSEGAPAPTTQASGLAAKDKKRLLMMASASLLLFIIVGVLAWWLAFGGKNKPTPSTGDTSSSTISQARLGIALTVIDGVVRFSSDGEAWEAAIAESQLKEGDYVRTNPDSRAVLTLDDGSAVRLDENSTIRLSSLMANAVEIEQINGTVYSRVVPSDRSFVVRIDETTYKALGTAFMTLKDTTGTGVQVFQSSVESSDLDEVIPEGKQHIKPFGDYVGEVAVKDIDIDAATDNAFINWNLAQDEIDIKFKEKLGVLAQVKLRAEEMRREQEAADVKSRAEVDRILQERLAAEKEKEESETKETVTRGIMTLSLKDDTFHWNYTGKAVHGYKLVYSKNTEEPTFGRDDAVYFGSINDNSGSLPDRDKIGAGRYYVRVCAYTAGTETAGCVDYSSAVVKNV